MYKGNHVNIRLLSLNDIAAITDLRNQEYYMQNLTFDLPKFSFREQLEKEFKESLEKQADFETNFLIETKEGIVIGEIGIDFLFWKNGIAFIYQYIADEKYLDSCYYDEAIKLFVEFAFMEKNARKLKIQVLSTDTCAIAALKANGFETEVVQREEVFRGGKYYDLYDMALLKENYKA